MHPILSDKTKLTIYLAVWGIIGILSGLIVAYTNELDFVITVAFTFPMMLLYGEINLSAWYLCRAFPIGKVSIWKILLAVGIAVLVISSLWTLICWGWMITLEKIFNVTVSPIPTLQTLIVILGAAKQLLLISIALSYLIIAFQRSREAERNAFESKLLAQSAELKALRMQIDPHFLFNSLNSISALTVSNSELARIMTTTLADFFRKSLSYGAKEFISLQDELSLLNNYLDIEKIRFGKRLNVIQNIEQNTLSCLVPPLLLQPLVENAIKHGIADSLDGGTIVISAQKKSDRLFISVENPFEEDSSVKKGTGLGLEIVKKRLITIYGNESDLKTTAQKNIFQVLLFFPASVSK